MWPLHEGSAIDRASAGHSSPDLPFSLHDTKWHAHSEMRPSSRPTHQHGGREEVTMSQRRPSTRAGLVMLNALSIRPGKGLELGGLGVTTLIPIGVPEPA